MNAQISSYNPGAMLSLAAVTTTVTVTGAKVGMCAYANPSADPGALVSWSCWISANDTVSLRLFALGALTPTVVNWNVRVVP